MNDFAFLKKYVDTLPVAKRRKFVFKTGLAGPLISEEEGKARLSAPRELRSFYNFSYGARLLDYQILTITEIAAEIAQIRATYPQSLRATDKQISTQLLPFALLLGVGDYLVFDLGQTSEAGTLIRDGFHEFPPDQWKPICYGLKTLFANFIKTNFEPFWLKK